MFIYLPVYRLTAPVQLHPRSRPSRPQPTDLDWHFTIAHACLVTALDMCNVPVDGGTTQKQAAT